MKFFLRITFFSIVGFFILSPFLAVSYGQYQFHKDAWITEIDIYIHKITKIVPQYVQLSALVQAALDPQMKYIAVREGMRKEEIAEIYQDALGWSDIETEEFATTLGCYIDNEEGYLYPSVYVVPKDAEPEEIKDTMKQKFEEMIAASDTDVSSVVNLDTIVKIASIIQREAAGKEDARLVSGIIWNRLFNGMKLDMDATLQYVKGTEEKWWPKVESEDKYVESPYNTYMYEGLPPTPISNPGIWAIEAALNPQKTDCFYYLHDKRRNMYCAQTYAQHKKNINLYLR